MVLAKDGDLVVVRPGPAEAENPQALPIFYGISDRSAGAALLSMYKITVPPGGKAEPHFHDGFETAIYVLKGRVDTRHGLKLEKSAVTEAGDFLFIPPGVPHQPVNLSKTDWAEAIVARSEPGEKEKLVAYEAPAS